MSPRTTRVCRTTVSIAVFLLAWEFTARLGAIHISLFPPPSSVLTALVEMARSGELLRDVRASLWRAVLGCSIGSTVGVGIGLLTGRLTILDHYLSPLLQLFRPLPPVAIIPLVIVWFGIGEVSKLFSIAFAVFFPVWLNTHLGGQNTPQTFLWNAWSLEVRGLPVLWKVILPAALPFVAAGLRTGVALAFVMVFVSELAGASAGIGYQISVSHLAYRVDRMIAALAVLAGLGALADWLLAFGISRAFPWLTHTAQK